MTPQKITPQSQPQFPCWLWNDGTHTVSGRPRWIYFEEEVNESVMKRSTHWHPDQPHAPAPVREDATLANKGGEANAPTDRQGIPARTDKGDVPPLTGSGPLSAATGESTGYHGSAAHRAVRRRDEQVHGMLIGGWHLCQHGHGVVKNSEQCPQCALEATLNPDQKAAMLKAWAQEQVTKSNKHLKQLSQVFSERSTEQPRRPVQGNVSGGNQNPTSADAGMDAGTVGDKKALAPTPPPNTATDAAATPRIEEEASPTECRMCKREYALRDGEEPTEYCDRCAHEVIDALKENLRNEVAQNAALKEELTLREKHAQISHANVAALKAELATVRLRFTAFEGGQSDLRGQLAAAALEIARDQATIDDYKKQLTALTRERDELKRGYKNLHRVICEAADYHHDETDWGRDEASLAEWIRKRNASARLAVGELGRHLELLERAEQIPEWWDTLTVGQGIATLNGYRNAIEKCRNAGLLP